jgi:hypothetical protein
MSRQLILASFAREEDFLRAVHDTSKRGWNIVDVYSPYAVHGLEGALGWRRSRLSVACFLGGAAGILLATWFQFWTTAWDWPLNVGGRPWNSLPAFVPVIFESMVLLGAFTLVFAWLIRSRLYPGKRAALPLPGVTDASFVVVIRDPGSSAGEVQQLLHTCHAVALEERSEEDRQ